MNDTRRVVLLPRFTTLAGADTAFATQPFPVGDAHAFDAIFWRGPIRGGGTAPVVSFQMERSMDLELWVPMAAGITPAENEEVPLPYAFEAAWLRLVVTLIKDDPGDPEPSANCWAIGTLRLRDPCERPDG